MTKANSKNLKAVYNRIAEGFYNLRQQPITPEIKKLAEKWKPGKLLDAGCGIGNSTLPFSKKGFGCFYLDFSSKMIRLAKKFSEKNKVKIKPCVGNILRLPFRDREFDYVISIAALHHLDSEKKRLQVLKEIKRVLKGGGGVFLSVWNREAKKDSYISWTCKGVKYHRYYHFFSKEELRKLLQKAGFKQIDIFLDWKKKNICSLATK